MDQVGEIWAGLLEDLSNNRLEDALNEFMRLSNTVSRTVEENDKKVAVELEREGETRLTKALAAEIQRISKQSIARARNGDLSATTADVDECLRLLRVRIGVDLISRNASAQSTTAECRQPIKQMMVVHLTVICAQKRDELRARLDLKKKAKNIVTSAEDGFLDAIEACAAYVAAQCKVCFDSEMPLSPPTETVTAKETDGTQDEFFEGLVRSLHEVGASQVKLMMQWFQEDRRIKTYWFKRADELGGLTLPRALHHHQDKAPTPTPSPPPRQGPSRGSTPANVTVKPLDESESASLDLLLHESSQILSLCEEFQKGLLDEIALEFVSAMVKLDELWLTHNVTKAVTHAVSIEIESPIWVNSVAEDTFHVVGTCFARAVNSHSLFASEATANHVAGFISDGFFEILKELIRKDAPSTSMSSMNKGESKATRAVAQIGTSRSFVSTSTITPLFIEAINTLASARSYCESLREEMMMAFEQSFRHMHAMAPLILDEAMKSMDALLEESTQTLIRSILSAKALRVLNDALDPRALPYELNVVAFERENIVKASWVKDYVEAQFRTNLVFKECIPTLSHGPASQVVQGLVKSVCDQFEERLTRLRFTALGALQFDKDVRSLCETIVVECNSLSATAAAALMEGTGPNMDGGSVGEATAIMQKLALEDARKFDAEVRSQFRRLRHWAFLLNLERASDQKEIAFPAKALSDEDIQVVLKRRIERDFFA